MPGNDSQRRANLRLAIALGVVALVIFVAFVYSTANGGLNG